MTRTERLSMISRVCYYLAWIAAVAAAVFQIGSLEAVLIRTAHFTGRNLLEASLLFFLACLASEVRAMGAKSHS